MIDLENVLSADQSGEILGLTRRWAEADTMDRMLIEELIRAKFQIFIREVTDTAVDEFLKNMKGPQTTPEFLQWVSIYDAEILPRTEHDRFCREQGWDGGDDLEFIATRKFGTYGLNIIVQQRNSSTEEPEVFFYINRDWNPEQWHPEDAVTIQLFCKAPDILGSL